MMNDGEKLLRKGIKESSLSSQQKLNLIGSFEHTQCAPLYKCSGAARREER
jgi:hypothetical protein